MKLELIEGQYYWVKPYDQDRWIPGLFERDDEEPGDWAFYMPRGEAYRAQFCLIGPKLELPE